MAPATINDGEGGDALSREGEGNRVAESLNVLITGGAGFIGKALARRLLSEGIALDGAAAAPVGRMVLFDPFAGEGLPDDPRVEVRTGDIGDPAAVAAAADGADLIWHLAAVVSSEAEADFDLGMRVNLHGTLNLLEAARAGGRRPRLVFASSCAIYGGELPPLVGDGQAPAPKTSYGTQKAVGELLVADYSRRGFIDGRSVRLPTIAVRPGRPNRAASTFVSSIIREPLKGEPAVCPVDPQAELFVASPRRAVEAMVLVMALSDAAIGPERTLPLPGLKVSVRDMVAALERVAGPSAAELIRWEPDATIATIVAGWPVELAATRARELGFPVDRDFTEIVRAHIEDEAPSRA